MAENHEKMVIRESSETVVRSLSSDDPSDGGDEEAPMMEARASGEEQREKTKVKRNFFFVSLNRPNRALYA